MPSIPKFEFHGPHGQALSGRLHLPVGKPRAFVLFAHCFTCGKDLRISTRMASALADAGYGVLRFDFTGLGESEGELADTTFSSNVEDLVAAADYLREHHAAPALLVGHSLGGAAVIVARPLIDEVRAVVTIGAPAEPVHVRALIDRGRAAEGDAGDDAFPVVVGGRHFRLGRGFIEDLERQDGAARAAVLDAALLVMHSPQDEVVGIDDARALYDAARHPKSYISLDGADHLLSAPGDAEYAAGAIVAWVERYLPRAREVEPPELARGEVQVRIGPQGLAVDVIAGRHRFRMDEPVEVGGGDTGPTPYDQLLAGLGACTVMTLRMYAERKGWPLEGASVRLEHGRMHARDCADCETREGRIDVIDRDLTLEGPLNAEQRKRLLEIAERCPVHRTLKGETIIHTHLLE